MRLDDIHIRRGQPRVGQRLPDHPLLRRTVRRGQSVARTVLVHRTAAQHREHPVPVATSVRQPLHDEQAHTLRPADAVRARAEGLAATVGGQAPQTGELHEGDRRGHHGDTAGQREVALAVAQGVRREVQGDQGGGAGGVDGDGRALEAVGVRQPAGGDAARAAAEQVALEVLRGQVRPGAVVAVHQAGEHAGARAAQAGGVDPGVLEALPGGLQQQALLGVDGDGLARRHAEELGVEAVGVVQEAALAAVGGAGALRVRVVEGVQVPAAVLRERGDRVRAVDDQAPEVLRRADPVRVAAGHADDRDRLVPPFLDLPQLSARLTGIGDGLLEIVAELVLARHDLSTPGGRGVVCLGFPSPSGARSVPRTREAGRDRLSRTRPPGRRVPRPWPSPGRRRRRRRCRRCRRCRRGRWPGPPCRRRRAVPAAAR